MITAHPDYYPGFRCLAGECRHTCCAGWEIDVDEESLARFERTEGPVGDRLREAISRENTPHFILGEGERCPFLNGDGLCDLILFGGEAFLCRICTDHPRWRSFLPGRTEVGLGLCCEAAGALILGWKEPVSMTESGQPEPADEEEEYLLALRERMLALGQDRSRPVRERMERILSLFGLDSGALEPAGWLDFYKKLERLDPAWEEMLEELAGLTAADEEQFSLHMAARETELEQLLVYFIHRHFLPSYDDGDPAGKAAFAVLSVRLLMKLGAAQLRRTGSFSFEDHVELCRRYSGEVEYSQENLEALFDALAEV